MVPQGWRGIRGDLATWFRVHQANTLWRRIVVVASSRPLWALMFYRWGRWIYTPATPGGRVLRQLSRIVFGLSREWVIRFTRASIQVQAEVGEDVWIGGFDTVRIAAGTRIGRGSRLHGGNTLGLGGRAPNRGTPSLGERVVLSPGAVLVGPLVVADDVVLGPNASASKSIHSPGVYLGSPPRPVKSGTCAAVPTLEAIS